MTRTSYELADWQGYLTHGEIDLLKEAARRLPPDPLVINIGAGAGTSTLAFLEERQDALVISIDIRCDELPHLTNEHLRLKEIERADALRAIRIWGDSRDVGLVWRWPADLVFVDGDHEEAGVRGDIFAWCQHVKLGGYMAFHDYGSEKWPAVQFEVDCAMAAVGWQMVARADTVAIFERQDVV